MNPSLYLSIRSVSRLPSTSTTLNRARFWANSMAASENLVVVIKMPSVQFLPSRAPTNFCTSGLPTCMVDDQRLAWV